MKHLFDTSHELGRVLLTLRRPFLQAAGFSLAINLTLLVPAIYMLQVYDRVLSGRNTTTLVMLTLIVVILYCFMGFLERVRSRLLLRVGVQIDEALSERVFTAAFERHLRCQGGNPAQAMQDLSTTRQFLAGTGALAFFDAPWAPIFIVVIAIIHPLLGLFSLIVAVILFALAWLNELLTHKPLAEANNVARQAMAFANNNLRSGETIAAMGMLPAMRARWSDIQGRVLGLQTIASDRAGSMGAMGKTARVGFQSLILGIGAWLVLNDAISAGGMIAASILLGRALAPIELLIGAWKQWVFTREAHGRISELLDRFPAPAQRLSLPAPTGALSIEGVSARPPGSEVVVLRNLAFRIPAGDVIGVIGPSGAGKSSLARLLVGLWTPSAGHVRLDGAEIDTWDRTQLGPYLGYLPQEIALFEGTVAENIARFGVVDSERIVAAASLVGIHDMILRLPLGYNTAVGADGGTLSGGQRQRIGLARAVYGEPRLVVLDEPNSNLDEPGEAALLRAMVTLKQRGCTVVFVSHGPRLLGAADKLLALNEGAMYAYGPRNDVLAHLQGKTPAAAQAAVQAPLLAQQAQAAGEAK